MSNARYENTLILSFLSHTYPRPFRDGKDVRGVIISTLRPVLLDDGIRV